MPLIFCCDMLFFLKTKSKLKKFMVKQENKKLLEFLTTFIVESDAIESIKDDPNLVKKQLEINSKDGHVGALLLLESLAHEKEKALTEDVVRKVQGLITTEQRTKPGGIPLKPEWIGKYRNVNVYIGGRPGTPFLKVPERMYQWASGVRIWQRSISAENDMDKLCQIAGFHFEYEHIHPFADGNGRSGRAIVYYLMRYCDLVPFIFTADDRFETYYRCFSDPEVMCQYFEKSWTDETRVLK